MSSDFDELQEMVMADAHEVYSDTVIDHAMQPRNIGEIRDPSGFARITGPCGDTMEMWIKVSNDVITSVRFMTDGCGPSIASGSMVTEIAKGKNINEVLRIDQDDVMSSLGGLPEESEHCALLAASTIKAAIRDHMAIKREPWKRAYRKY